MLHLLRLIELQYRIGTVEAIIFVATGRPCQALKFSIWIQPCQPLAYPHFIPAAFSFAV